MVSASSIPLFRRRLVVPSRPAFRENVPRPEQLHIRVYTDEGERISDVPASTSEIVEGLNDLLQLDHDAIGAYEIALEQLENREYALQIDAFRRDHERHIQKLNDAVLELGGTPANEPHATAPLKQAVQRLSGAGGDKSLLSAWRANELQVMTKYDSYAQRAVSWPASVKRLIDENALDEERHYQWIVKVMAENQSEGDFTSRMRESATRARQVGAQAQERIVSAAGEARAFAADKLQQAAGQLEDVATQNQSAEGMKARAAEGAHRLATGLGATASLLREGGSGEGDLKEAAEQEIRSNLGRSLVATFAVGFLIGRILR
jgi:rubrerythrin